MRQRRRRRVPAVALVVVALSGIAGCGADSGGPPNLVWYTNPDSGGQDEIAARCTEASGGQYTISTSVLPRDASSQREQLVRRLAANDSSIDLMSLDPPYIPEFANAGFLAPMPDGVAERVSEGVVQSAIDGSTWEGELVTVPFWANTQLLWYKESVAQAAGLDMTQPVTWEQLVQAAEQQESTLAVQGIRAESLMVWLNALIESAGGAVITETAEVPENIELGLESEATVRAAEVMEAIGSSGLGGPALSTADEDANATTFEGGEAGFMVNWPFIWPRALSAVEGGTLDPSVPEDYGWALYPRVNADDPTAPPYGGINIGVGAFSDDPDLAYAAAECITTVENQTYYFISNGNPAAKTAVYDDPEVLEEFPMAPVIRESLELAVPRPQTAYYSEVSGAIQRTFHPPGAVTPGASGEAAAELIRAILAGEELL